MLKDRMRPKEEPELDPQAEKKAVALKYDMEKNRAPKLVAKGKGHVAQVFLRSATRRSTAAIHTSGLNQYTARHTHRSRLHRGSRWRAWVVSWARTCRNVSGDSTAAGVR